ncbi:probable G-protein coupled receptor 33 [Pleurodeles waltl]|uniref:probable G-protein coupled receptor 33 n=1 Tax=Pleurodeles waltl TaxID=8319 RepID=UPI003709ADC1
MALHNRTYYSTTWTFEEKDKNTVNLVSSVFFFFTSSVGIFGNSLFLWTLGFKMMKTVNTVWFFSLVLSGWTYSMVMPILGVFALLDFHWPFGIVMCKVVNMLLSLSMHVAVFILTIISLDRYVLVVHPIWARHHRTPKCATIISYSIWSAAFILSAPYLAFRELKSNERNKTICTNNYVFSDDWKTQEVQTRRQKIHLCLFLIRLLVAFILPFMVIASCYVSIALKVNLRSLSRSSKLIKVIMVSVVSFFVCWTPVHLYNGLILYRESVPKLLMHACMLVAAIATCVNVCFTPIFYIFIGENFKAVFKKSLLYLIESAFHE